MPIFVLLMFKSVIKALYEYGMKIAYKFSGSLLLLLLLLMMMMSKWLLFVMFSFLDKIANYEPLSLNEIRTVTMAFIIIGFSSAVQGK
jgi:hypothetical protein